MMEIPSLGYAAIYGPDGDDLCEPCTERGKDQIIYADIKLDDILPSKYLADRAGHYSRPDLHHLVVNANPNPLVRHEQRVGVASSSLDRFPPLSSVLDVKPVSKADVVREAHQNQSKPSTSDGSAS